jgi:putative transposase
MVGWPHKVSVLFCVIVLETKLRGNPAQFALIDDAIRTAQFIRNKCLRYWMDNKGVGQYDLSLKTGSI